ncbi:MAG: aminopeptidase P family protein [Zetaproteobacteria bacterium]|nr:MAG: aminopeptidase P family protein [Zetaproteobacteria bacterium]
MTDRAKLIIADSEHHADMLYAAGIFVPDPFIAAAIGGEWHGLFSTLEVDRARKHARFDQVHLDQPWRQQAQTLGFGEGLAATAAAFLRHHGIRSIDVPGDFPLRYADQLRQWGFELRALNGSMFPEREIKQPWEIEQLRKAERLTRQAMAEARRFLAECTIEAHGFLRHCCVRGRVRADDLRRVIECALVARGAMPAHTIVACGRQGADPHNIGRGLLRAHEPIIIDIFPRLLASGYWGDMTRTFVKGSASERVQRMYQAVRAAQALGLSMVRAGVNAREIHAAILDHFRAAGFTTGSRRGRQVGFIHGTGHGVGLEIHEAPRVSRCDQTLRTGHVITIEPGLYYPDVGGVRLEDLVVVTEDGHENLTRYPCRLEVP